MLYSSNIPLLHKFELTADKMQNLLTKQEFLFTLGQVERLKKSDVILESKTAFLAVKRGFFRHILESIHKILLIIEHLTLM